MVCNAQSKGSENKKGGDGKTGEGKRGEGRGQHSMMGDEHSVGPVTAEKKISRMRKAAEMRLNQKGFARTFKFVQFSLDRLSIGNAGLDTQSIMNID